MTDYQESELDHFRRRAKELKTAILAIRPILEAVDDKYGLFKKDEITYCVFCDGDAGPRFEEDSRPFPHEPDCPVLAVYILLQEE